VALFDFFPRTLKTAQPNPDKNIKKECKYETVKSLYGYKRYINPPKAMTTPTILLKVSFSLKNKAKIIIVNWTTASNYKVATPAHIFM
ncbi:hypothetical protein ACN4FY_11550, partial [Aliarcobacter butzleri]|uniref:hypothetical protein n=1 Tax=Aliarcobacter butzleri TaxID=28197 RepID=UPI003AF64D6B